MTLGEKLQLLRKSRGLSQEQLAEVLEVSRQAVSKWECGDSAPDLDKLRAICTYFGVTTDYLIWENPEDAPQGSDSTQKTTDHAVRREGIRTFVRENRHWLGYIIAIVGGVMLVRSLMAFFVMLGFSGAFQSGEVFGMLGRAYVPYLLLYAALLVGGLLLARRLKKRNGEREAHDDL